LDKNAVWSELVLEISNCRRCRLSESRTRAVPGEGSLNAKVMFIGEAPGRSEDEAGRPFVGAAGKLLNELLSSNGMRREEVFITNVVKCRPPENRDPLEDEILSCSHFTNSIIQLIQPSIIVTLGNHAGRYVIEFLGGSRWYGVSRMRGNVYKITLFGKETLVRLSEMGLVSVREGIRATMSQEGERTYLISLKLSSQQLSLLRNDLKISKYRDLWRYYLKTT